MARQPHELYRLDETPVYVNPEESYQMGLPLASLIRVEPRGPREVDRTPPYSYHTMRQDCRPDEPWIRFGEWLVRRGLITPQDLFLALHTAFLRSCRIGDVLVDERIMDRVLIEQEAEAYGKFLAFQCCESESPRVPG